MMRKPSTLLARKRDNSRRIAGDANGRAFFCNAACVALLQGRGEFDTSIFIVGGKTYAESQVHSATKRATKPGTREKGWRIPDRKRPSRYAPGIRRDAYHGRWNLGRACGSGRGRRGLAARCRIGNQFHRHRGLLWSRRE